MTPNRDFRNVALRFRAVWDRSLNRLSLPTPIVDDDVAYLMSGLRSSDAAGSQAIGRHNRSTSYVPSALLYEDSLIFLRSNPRR